MSETAEKIDEAALDIMEVLRRLPTPRHAAAVIAIVRANLFGQGGAKDSARVAQMMDEDDKAAFEIWEKISASYVNG